MGATAHKRWSQSEILYLDEHRWTSTAAAIAIHLGRSVPSVHGRMFKDYARRRSANVRAQVGPRVPLELEIVPPPFVLHERQVRRCIPRTTVTQVVFSDPKEGYSALDTKTRKISVQDALEICALYNHKPGEIISLANTYGVSRATIDAILDGSFFDRLIPQRLPQRKREND